jgi:hypothetical protein
MKGDDVPIDVDEARKRALLEYPECDVEAII